MPLSSCFLGSLTRLALALLMIATAPIFADGMDDCAPVSPLDCDGDYRECMATARAAFNLRGSTGAVYLAARGHKQELLGMGVIKLFPDGAAAKAGMKLRDIVVAWNGQAVTEESSETFFEFLQDLRPGSSIQLTVLRDGKTREMTLRTAAVEKLLVDIWGGRYVKDHYGCAKFKEYWRAEKIDERLYGDRFTGP